MFRLRFLISLEERHGLVIEGVCEILILLFFLCFDGELNSTDWISCLDLLGKFFMRQMVERLRLIGL